MGKRFYCLSVGDIFSLGETSMKLLLKQIKYKRHTKFNILKPKTWFKKRYFIFMVIK